MFVGRYEHQLDNKGRVVLPPAYRGAIGELGYVTGLGNRIGLWDQQSFEAVMARWRQLRTDGTLPLRQFTQLTTSVQTVRCDATGRVTLPKELLTGFELGSPVVLAGVDDKIEIWPSELFHSETSTPEAEADLRAVLDRLAL